MDEVWDFVKCQNWDLRILGILSESGFPGFEDFQDFLSLQVGVKYIYFVYFVGVEQC